MIKAILFDVDGVLIDSFDANLKFFQDLLLTGGYKPLTKEEFIPLVHLPMYDVIKIITIASDEKVYKLWEIGKNDKNIYPYHLLKMPPYAEEVVKELGKNYVLGLVTSRVREKIYTIPLLARLNGYFKIAVGYQDTKNHKPDPEPLIFACKKLGFKPEEVIYIGDQESDVIAAKSAKIKIIFLSKIKNKNADINIKSFKQLIDAIESLL